MNDPGAQRPGEPVPLDQRYQGADPIEWCGAAVYPMYTEALPAGTTAVRLRALSVMAPEDVTGLGLGLSVHDGHVNLNGKSLAGVDIWSDALAEGIDISVTADAPDALFTLTPVWVAESGTHQSWTGNYGMVVDLLPDGASTLWCSTGPGTPDFNELVVELSTGPAEPAPPVVSTEPEAPAAKSDPPPDLSSAPADPPTPPRPAGQGVGGALHDLGTAMHARGEHDSARALWTQAAEAGHSGAAFDLGTLLLQQGERAAAEQWWKAAAHDDPRAAASLSALSEQP
ncbi:type IV pilus biogenesis/stability protein PilW [Nocardia sp. NPDC058519]|uniref:tetratricopeptide repeat protein n=1 Tax=Nocardia sp. NPDC058519 TaxID=3346535 RepID=UPI0036669248